MKLRPKKKWNPTKLSELIRDAVADAKKAERDKRYRLYMWVFHRGAAFDDVGDKCEVCIAGAVMAKRLGAPRTATVEPTDYSKRLKDLLYAVDTVRDGSLLDAQRAFRKRLTEEQKQALSREGMRLYQAYNVAHAGRADWADYLSAAKALAKVGL